jgi:hypothetical protein
MNEAQNEEEWRAEFERLGELLVYDSVKQGAIYNDEAKRQAAFRWLSGEATARRVREVRTYKYAQWTYYAAIAAVAVGLIGIVASVLMR